MPNGHGGYPYLGGPVILAIVFIVVAVLPEPLRERLGWAWLAAGLWFAAMAGWRLAYHLHLRAADNYGGAYTSKDAYRAALRRYWMLAPVYAVLAGGVGYAILAWRGLPA